MKILITGFAGTIGGEFTRQLLAEGHEVFGVDNNEWAVAAFPDHPNLTKLLMDFSFVEGDYDRIIHCAAYKHVELVEANEASGWDNNVTKTQTLYRNTTTRQLLFISTDKAVEPLSHYGRSKQEGERLTSEHGGVIARLGNVIGSSGSVIPKWEGQISRGEPITITDYQMTRYMIPVDEAVAKILALWPHAKPSQVIIPEMGGAVGLNTLKTMVLYARGLPYNYPIKVIGIRPGEKKHETLKWPQEQTVYRDENGEVVCVS